jgi:hypothetical protein
MLLGGGCVCGGGGHWKAEDGAWSAGSLGRALPSARGHWECWTTGVGVCKQAFVVVMLRRIRFVQGCRAESGVFKDLLVQAGPAKQVGRRAAGGRWETEDEAWACWITGVGNVKQALSL